MLKIEIKHQVVQIGTRSCGATAVSSSIGVRPPFAVCGRGTFVFRNTVFHPRICPPNIKVSPVLSAAHSTTAKRRFWATVTCRLSCKIKSKKFCIQNPIQFLKWLNGGRPDQLTFKKVIKGLFTHIPRVAFVWIIQGHSVRTFSVRRL